MKEGSTRTRSSEGHRSRRSFHQQHNKNDSGKSSQREKRRTTQPKRRRSAPVGSSSSIPHTIVGENPSINDDDASLSLDDLSIPLGPLRMNSMGHISVLSMESGEDQQHDRDTDSRRSNLRSIHEALEEGPVVQAMAAADYENELEEAREQGRLEVRRDIPLAFARDRLPRVSDNDGDDESVDEKRNRKVFMYFALICCLILAVATAGTLLLFGASQEQGFEMVASSPPSEDPTSNLKAVIVYEPPTEEECEAIVNGELLDEQISTLLQRAFDVHIEIRLADEADYNALVADMVRHVQEKLIPLMAGCDGLNPFEAMYGNIGNATNAVTNGQVLEAGQEACDGGAITDTNCRSYVLMLDLYLEEDVSNAILLEMLGATIESEELATTLGALYPVQTASVASKAL